MATLVLRRVPEELYRRLQRNAALHRRSLTQETIALLESGLSEPAMPAKPSADEVREWLRRDVSSLPIMDSRSPEDIRGYDEHGSFD